MAWPRSGAAYTPVRPLHLPLLLAALGLTAAACSSGSRVDASPTPSGPPAGEGRSVVVGTVAPCVPPSPIPFGDVAKQLPPGLAFPPGSRLLEVDVTGGVTTIVGETRTAISPLQAHFRAELVAAGREIFSEDNEGIEAELFFTLPGGGIGVVRETKARCPLGMTRFSFSLT